MPCDGRCLLRGCWYHWILTEGPKAKLNGQRQVLFNYCAEYQECESQSPRGEIIMYSRLPLILLSIFYQHRTFKQRLNQFLLPIYLLSQNHKLSWGFFFFCPITWGKMCGWQIHADINDSLYLLPQNVNHGQFLTGKSFTQRTNLSVPPPAPLTYLVTKNALPFYIHKHANTIMHTDAFFFMTATVNTRVLTHVYWCPQAGLIVVSADTQVQEPENMSQTTTTDPQLINS